METIHSTVEQGIALITLNRPEKRNAINLKMVEELTVLLDQYRQDPEVKVLIFTGEGQVFISGGDLSELILAKGKEEAFPVLYKIGELLENIDQYPKPTIAMINGTAIGGGCEFAGSCHFRFAVDTAMLGFVQIGMHIITGWGGGSRLFDKLNEANALSMLLTGERISAEEAKRLGFLQEIFPAEQLEDSVMNFASKIASQPIEGIEAYLRILSWKREGVSREERIKREIEKCSTMWGSEQHAAVVQRFLKKR
ncbi:enoyl-CoA hydratase/isomerase family protein [Brevibacillus ginsengisoli]|uniref:enoyl-CoA hydratase/isomerase family protein n=1 Tax=Brevibacillus ginsengisoli TaxID=363854 RepID=UPI003CF6C78B